MASFVIEGGHKLHGEIHPQGAKNEVLQILCATLLTSEEVTVTNIPDILDVNNLIQLLRDVTRQHPKNAILLHHVTRLGITMLRDVTRVSNYGGFQPDHLSLNLYMLRFFAA